MSLLGGCVGTVPHYLTFRSGPVRLWNIDAGHARAATPRPGYTVGLMNMPATDPIRALAEQAGATFIPYGPAAARPGPRGEGDGQSEGAELVAEFGAYEAEYAAIRKGVGILDTPQRGVVSVAGSDRLAFLQSMLTNDAGPSDADASRVVRSFLLGREGRIKADLVLCVFDDGHCWLDVDRCDAAAVAAELDRHVFTEDVAVADASPAHRRLSLHGPQAAALLARVGAGSAARLEPGRCARATVGSATCRLYRRDETGAPGFHLFVHADAAIDTYRLLADAVGGLTPDVEAGTRREVTGRGVGWLAYNTARIEAGSPLFHIDFGPDSLPHETGVLAEAVSFTKGCFPGQEVVARTQNLGHPRRTLAGLRCADATLPITGAEVFDPAETTAVIGAVTSSTCSPLLGQTAIAYAMVRWGRHQPGTEVLVAAGGGQVPATVQGLAFVPA